MSINDLLESEWFLSLILAGIAIAMLVSIPGIFKGLSDAKRAKSDIYGDNECGPIIEEQNVRIIARRTMPHPLNHTASVNMAVFEFTNGNRIELAIWNSSAYSTMVEGDCGTLKYQGKRFVSFRRYNVSET